MPYELSVMSHKDFITDDDEESVNQSEADYDEELVWTTADHLASEIAEQLGWDTTEDRAIVLGEYIAVAITEAINGYIDETEDEQEEG
ncbi:MAG: hypothetical protein WCK64_07925 [Synechococcaceae cyanobacterium ELA445]